MTVGSDHGPVDPALKRRGDSNVFAGQPGMPANETMAPLMLDLVARGELTLGRLAEVMSEAPARLYGLYPRKGAIQVGSDGDFTLVDLNATWTIRGAELVGRAGWTPYEDETVTGRVAATIIRGRIAARDGRSVAEPGQAAFIPRIGASNAL